MSSALRCCWRPLVRTRYLGALALVAWAASAVPATQGEHAYAHARVVAATGSQAPLARSAVGLPSNWWVPPGLISPEAQVLLARLAAAERRGDDAALDALARLGVEQDLDPWLLLDELLGLGLRGAAESYAQHAPSQRRELLAEVARAGAGQGDLAARQDLLRLAQGHLDGSPCATLLRPLPPAEAPPGSLLALRLQAARGSAAWDAGRPGLGAVDLAEAALAAEARGWWTGAREGWSDAARAAHEAGHSELEARQLGRLVELAAAHGTPAEQIGAWIALAAAEERLGDGPQALRRLLEAARLAEQHSEPALAGTAHSLSMDIFVRCGALGAALEARTHAEAALHQAHAGGAARGEHLMRVAVLERALGRWDLAQGALERAAVVLQTAPYPRAHLSLTLGRAALALPMQGPSGAAGALLEAQAACAGLGLRATAAQRWDLAWLESLHALASAEEASAPSRGLTLALLHERVEALVTQATEAGWRGEALAARCLTARVALSLGRPVASELTAVAGAAQRLRLLPLRLEALTALARAQLLDGSPQAATATARDAFRQAAELGRGLPEAQRATLQSRFGGLCRVALEAAAAAASGPSSPDAAALWLDVLEIRQAVALQQALGARELLEDPDAAEAPPTTLEQRARGRREAYAALTLQQTSGDVSERGRELLRRQEARYAAALRAEQAAQVELERSSLRDARAEELAPLAVGLDPLREALPSGAAYVAYALLEDETWALVVTGTSARPVRLCRGPAQMGSLRAALERVAEATAVEGAPSLVGAAAEQARLDLRRSLLEPLGLPTHIRTLVIAPDPTLVFVPWAWVLGGEPALDVALAPSATAFAWLAGRNAAAGRGTLAIGSPAYPDRLGLGAGLLRGVTRASPATVLPAFRPLPFSMEEARNVASRPGDRLLLGHEANEQAFWAALASRGPRHRWRSLHFAVHGLVDPEHPALALLALAPSAEEDGLLTLAEIQRHRVPVDLVVLSACRTARGRWADGEGLLGLCRGFLMAGANQVLASLWDVPDAATAELMRELYVRLDAGLDAARALREAQAVVRAHTPDPAAWAAWVLWGLPSGPGAVSGSGSLR